MPLYGSVRGAVSDDRPYRDLENPVKLAAGPTAYSMTKQDHTIRAGTCRWIEVPIFLALG